MANYRTAATALRRAGAIGILGLSMAGCSTLGDLFVEPDLSQHGSAAAGPASDFETAMTRGKANFAAGKYGIALGQFEQALLMQPNSVRALNAIAATYDQQRNFSLADQYYMRAFRLAPSSSDLLNNVGYSHVLRGDPAGAQSYFALAKSLDPGNQVLAANLRLAQPTPPAVAAAAAPEAPPPPPAAPPPLPPFAEISRVPVTGLTVPLFGDTHFVRVAPGVQMLVTRPVPPPANLASAPPPRPTAVAASEVPPPPPSRPVEPVAVAAAPPPAPPPSAPSPPATTPTPSAGGARPNVALASARASALPVGAAWLLPASPSAPSAAMTGPAPAAPVGAPLPAAASASQPKATRARVESAPLPVGAAWLLPAPPAAPTAARSAAPMPRPAWPFYGDNTPRQLGLRFFRGVYLGASAEPPPELFRSTAAVTVDPGSMN
jgi:hypothetical protein